MGLIADRVQETTTTVGAGTLTLAGAVAGYQSFSSAFTNKQLVEYVIFSNTTDWEVGVGTFTTAGATLSRDIIRRSSNAGAAIAVVSGAKVWADIGADNYTSSVQKFRNRLLNGGWRFDQWFSGGVIAITGGAGTQAGVDGWSGIATGAGSFSMQQVADPDFPSLFALKLACTVADAAIGATDRYSIFQGIEGYDVADLKAGTASAEKITVSFPMKFDVAGTYGISIVNGAVNRTYVGTVTQNVASAREDKVVTLTLDTGGVWTYASGTGMYLQFCLAAGSNFQAAAGAWNASNLITTAAQCNFMSLNTNVGYIGRIQLERGGFATPFEEVDYARELARLERHFKVLCASGSATQIVSSGYGAAANAPEGIYTMGVPMRATPSLILSAAGHFAVFPSGAALTSLVINAGGYSNNRAVLLDGATAAGVALADGIVFACINASGFMALSARLT